MCEIETYFNIFDDMTDVSFSYVNEEKSHVCFINFRSSIGIIYSLQGVFLDIIQLKYKDIINIYFHNASQQLFYINHDGAYVYNYNTNTVTCIAYEKQFTSLDIYCNIDASLVFVLQIHGYTLHIATYHGTTHQLLYDNYPHDIDYTYLSCNGTYTLFVVDILNINK